MVTNTYRMALDAWEKDPASYRCDPAWMRELCSVSHREYHTGFYFGSPHEDANTVTRAGYIREKAYLATAVTDSDASGRATFRQRNKTVCGAPMELLTPGKVGIPFTGWDMRDAEGNPIESAPHPLMEFSMQTDVPVHAGDIIRAGGED